MTQESTSPTPLGPPPRRVQVRRWVRNSARAYSTVFTLLIVVLIGWALIDLWRWNELTHNERMLAIGFGLLAALCFAVLQLVNHPLRRELRLARRGAVAQGEIVRIGVSGRRRLPIVVFAFRTRAGDAVEGQSVLPRRFPVQTLGAGMPIEVLYDVKRPRRNQPRLAFRFVEFRNEGQR
jgi:hypothetical protein